MMMESIDRYRKLCQQCSQLGRFSATMLRHDLCFLAASEAVIEVQAIGIVKSGSYGTELM